MGQTKTTKPLPNTLSGAVCAQWRERGGKRYGPYYFRFWREGGRLHKQYITRNEVDAVRAACTRHREEQAARRHNHAEFMQMLRQYKARDAWAYRNGVTLEFSRPGKPIDNAFVESFNGHFRQECLDQHWFASLEEVQQILEAWRIDDNTERPHRALKQRTPAEFEAEWWVHRVAD